MSRRITLLTALVAVLTIGGVIASSWRQIIEWHTFGEARKLFGRWRRIDDPDHVTIYNFYSDVNADGALVCNLVTSHLRTPIECAIKMGVITLMDDSELAWQFRFEGDALSMRVDVQSAPWIRYEPLPPTHPLRHFDPRVIGYWKRRSREVISGSLTGSPPMDFGPLLRLDSDGTMTFADESSGSEIRQSFCADGSLLHRPDGKLDPTAWTLGEYEVNEKSLRIRSTDGQCLLEYSYTRLERMSTATSDR